jgi:predicted dithiol-disulfide oxidoreductase (DUF899 family)
MTDPQLAARIATLRARLTEVRGELRAALAEAAALEVEDYVFATTAGPVALSALFAGKRDLFVIHNMGVACLNCTLWADGFNGLYPHLADRAGFVLTSPDPPARQQAFAASRGWRFPMVSHAGTSFAADMGFVGTEGGWRPGVSVFRMDAGRIRRVAATPFAPRDDFCALWHFLDLLPDGPAGWQPKLSYG